MVEKYNFAGNFMPPEACLLFDRGKINHTELLFLTMLGGFCRTEDGKCFATNGYLAESLRLKERQTQNIVAKLKNLGIIHISFEEGRRVIRPFWRMDMGVTNVMGGAINCTPNRQKNAPISIKYKKKCTHNKNSRVFGENEMPHFNGRKPTSSKEKKLTKHQLSIARRMHVNFKERKVFVPKRNIVTTATAIRLLEDGLENGEQRVESVWSFYEKNYRRIKKPNVTSGSSFAGAFAWLEDIIEREKEHQVEITDDAKKVATNLRSSRWPKGSTDQLETAVQISLNNAKTFRQQLDESKPFHRRVSSEMPSILTFVRTWFERVHHRIDGWENWNGNLTALAFKVDSKEFQQMGKQWAGEYGNVSHWSKLMKEIESASSTP